MAITHVRPSPSTLTNARFLKFGEQLSLISLVLCEQRIDVLDLSGAVPRKVLSDMPAQSAGHLKSILGGDRGLSITHLFMSTTVSMSTVGSAGVANTSPLLASAAAAGVGKEVGGGGGGRSGEGIVGRSHEVRPVDRL